MGVETSQVFLVPGQWENSKSGSGKLSSMIEHHVVVARDSQMALLLIEQQAPGFKPLGFTALSEFENAVSKIRETLDGVDTGYSLIVEAGML